LIQLKVAGYVGRRAQTVDTVQHNLDATNVLGFQGLKSGKNGIFATGAM